MQSWALRSSVISAISYRWKRHKNRKHKKRAAIDWSKGSTLSLWDGGVNFLTAKSPTYILTFRLHKICCLISFFTSKCRHYICALTALCNICLYNVFIFLKYTATSSVRCRNGCWSIFRVTLRPLAEHIKPFYSAVAACDLYWFWFEYAKTRRNLARNSTSTRNTYRLSECIQVAETELLLVMSHLLISHIKNLLIDVLVPSIKLFSDFFWYICFECSFFPLKTKISYFHLMSDFCYPSPVSYCSEIKDTTMHIITWSNLQNLINLIILYLPICYFRSLRCILIKSLNYLTYMLIFACWHHRGHEYFNQDANNVKLACWVGSPSDDALGCHLLGPPALHDGQKLVDGAYKPTLECNFPTSVGCKYRIGIPWTEVHKSNCLCRD